MPSTSRPRRSVAVCLFLSLALHAPLAAARSVFVGPASDPDCDFHTIQPAIDDWAASTNVDPVNLFVANTQTYTATALTVSTPLASSQLTIAGNSGCRPTPSVSVRLDGTGNAGAPVIDINGSDAGEAKRFQVSLEALDITGGHFSGNGGGVRVRGNANLTLWSTHIHDNSALKGGGVGIEATAAGVPNVALNGSNETPVSVENNHATQDGGGVYCSNAVVGCSGYCRIAGNSAAGNGGGIAQDECTTLINATSGGVANGDIGLRANRSDGDGGGAWVQGGRFTLNGAPPGAVAAVVGNEAGRNGGALYLTGLPINPAIGLHDVQFDDNRSGIDGGALYANSGTVLADAGFSPTGCGAIDHCPRFRGNHGGNAGGAVALSGGAFAWVNNMMFTNNDAAHASVLQAVGSMASVLLINDHIAGNHGARELLLSSGASLAITHVTIADNGDDDDALIRFDAPASLSILNSVLYDFNGAASGVVVAAPSEMSYAIDCVLVHDDSGLDGAPGVTHLISADPQWDTSGYYAEGLYVPGPNSPAVDACPINSGVSSDMTGTSRPQDLPKPDGLGSYDMGAIERVSDRLFADGFEPF